MQNKIIFIARENSNHTENLLIIYSAFHIFKQKSLITFTELSADHRIRHQNMLDNGYIASLSETASNHISDNMWFRTFDMYDLRMVG